MLMPNIGQTVGLLIGAAASVVAPTVQATDGYILGRCVIIGPHFKDTVYPAWDGGSYLELYHGTDPRYQEFSFDGGDTKVTLIKAPAHGRLEHVGSNVSNYVYSYKPNESYKPKEGYSGHDGFVMQVEKNGVKIQIQYFIEMPPEGAATDKTCTPDGWKISATSSELDNTNLQTLLGAADLGNGVTVDFASLTGSAVGRTTGSTITLDTNAAGYGWFIDYTPTTNTRPPVRHYGWGAKAGRS